MSAIKNFLAGLGGAIAVTAIHEMIRKTTTNTPRLDLLGEETLQKSAGFMGFEFTDEDNLYLTALGADVVGNAVYYSSIGAAGKKGLWPAAVTSGLVAGAGAVLLPKPLGLNQKTVARNTKVKIMTIGYYLTGALVTAALLSAMKSEKTT